MITDQTNLTYKKIFIFWYPLAAAWFMMAVEGPFLGSIMARLPEAKINLAAYGVAISLAFFLEAPIIMLMSASTALCKNNQAFFKLQRFAYFLNGGVTLVAILLVIPPIFRFVAIDLFKLPAHLTHLCHNAVLIMLPWPFSIGYRRFYQGILIRYNLTRRVAYGTAIRLTSMSITAVILYYLKVTGVYVGASALAMGVVCEAAASRIMAHASLQHLKTVPPSEEESRNPLTYRSIASFYFPMALTTVLTLSIHIIVTYFMSSASYALESLAVLPLMNGLGFFFRSIGLSYSEVVIALLGDREQTFSKLRNFGIFLLIVAGGGLGIIAFTPLSYVWYHHIQGVSIELARFAILPTQIIVLLPALSVVISVQSAILVKTGKTVPLSWATILETFILVAVLYGMIHFFNVTGIVAAATAYVSGRIFACSFLLPVNSRALRSLHARTASQS